MHDPKLLTGFAPYPHTQFVCHR